MDGVDLKEIDHEALRRQIAVLFQNPVHYETTVRENIGFGEISALSDDKRLWQAASDAGALAPIERLPEGFDTILSKMFGLSLIHIWISVRTLREIGRWLPGMQGNAGFFLL